MVRTIALIFTLLPSLAHADPHTIIQVVGFHYVSPEDFAADLRDQDSGITQEEIDKSYREFLNDLKKEIRGQMLLLKGLIHQHNLKAVYVEGVTDQNHKAVLRFIKVLKGYEADKLEQPESAFDKLVAEQNKIDRLELGAAGQLVLSGDLQTILPAEEAKAYEGANPLKSGGPSDFSKKIEFDRQANERREDAIVRNLMKADGVAVITLGMAHNLHDNMKRLGVTSRYVRTGVHTDVSKNGKFSKKQKD